MRSAICIADVRFSLARDTSDGFLGFVSFEQCGHVLAGIALHQAAGGSYTLSYPKRRDQFGVKHPIVRPLDQAARDEITRQVIATLRARGEIP